MDAAADDLPDPPERQHLRGTQPLEEERRQTLRRGRGEISKKL